MNVHIIIGKNFGDEGKGLAVDYFTSLAQKSKKSCLVIRHNGGAQAGHTVNTGNHSFVFHQLSSGSFRNADTFWSDTFLPDFYKLQDEINSFKIIHNSVPKVYSSADCRCVIIDDVLLNMAVETSRGNKRHGSCGMGINEAVNRSANKNFKLTTKDIKTLSSQDLACKLKRIRKEYLPTRLNEYNISLDCMGEYGELLSNDNVIYNTAEMMSRSAEMVEIADDKLIYNYDEIIFEGAQGLLLDENYLKNAPHLTTSKTGSYNPIEFCKKNDIQQEIERVYITRSYVTRHGKGPLPYENSELFFPDKTNVSNEWQGTLRFAMHGNAKEFTEPVIEDLSQDSIKTSVSLMITHLNETNNCIYSCDGNIPVSEWLQYDEINSAFDKVYLSASPFSEEIYY